MGHSTGCQDAIHYLVTKPTSSSSPRPQIKSAILQAPVSDQEFFKSKYPGDHEARIWVKKATDMVLQGNGNEWLPIDASRSLVGEGEQLTPFTAYRYWSLFADGGDDDYFTSSLPEDALRFRDSTAQLLVLISEKDESYPSYLSTITSQEELLERWSDAAEGKISNLSAVLPGADHAVSQEDAAQEMFKIIEKFLAE
ncbi:hypothetical protein FRC02_008670 [Tulasnella sp. 418]|nr:hypothetical protein FRC02_008670 [Tulasnella sp. 418]